MNTEELKTLQQTELNILIAFDEYSKKHNLKYYLIGGALLGAARYKGFIPWDDDIDVAMPREDYEKLKQLWQKDSIKGYFLQHEKSDPNFARCIMKLRKDGTQIVEKSSANVKMHQGIYIDIFPIDFIEDNNFKKINKRAKQIRRLMTLRTIKSGYVGRYQRTKNLIRMLLFAVPVSIIDKKLYSLCTKENSSQTKYAILYLHNYNWQKQLHKKEVFGEGAEIDFEGLKFNAPAETDVFLKNVFGENYMEEPPKEKQKTPHNYITVKF